MHIDKYRLPIYWRACCDFQWAFFSNLHVQCLTVTLNSLPNVVRLQELCKLRAVSCRWREGAPHRAQPTHAARSRHAHFHSPPQHAPPHVFQDIHLGAKTCCLIRDNTVLIHQIWPHLTIISIVSKCNSCAVNSPGWWKAAHSAGDKSTLTGLRWYKTPWCLQAPQLLPKCWNEADFPTGQEYGNFVFAAQKIRNDQISSPKRDTGWIIGVDISSSSAALCLAARFALHTRMHRAFQVTLSLSLSLSLCLSVCLSPEKNARENAQIQFCMKDVRHKRVMLNKSVTPDTAEKMIWMWSVCVCVHVCNCVCVAVWTSLSSTPSLHCEDSLAGPHNLKEF